MMTKWYHWVILALALLLAGALFLAFRIWWTCPLGPPLDIEKAISLAPDYTRFWILWAGAVVVYLTIAFGVPLWLIALELRKQYR